MKAARIHEYGDYDQIQIEDIDSPQLRPGQVLVKVAAASLNPFDTTVRTGRVAQMVHLPVTLGGDLAGQVTEVAEDVTDFVPGDTIFGQAAAVAGNSGAFAEQAATKSNQIAKAPTSISIEEAASLPLVGVSAFQALTEHINLQPNQTILIQGGAGAIGSVAIQLAKHLGAHVIATATGDGIEFAKNLGADKVIDYRTQKFEHEVGEANAVFDTVGGETFARSYAVVKPGGTLVTMIGQPDQGKAQQQNITVIAQQTRTTTERLQKLAGLVDQGIIKPHIAKTFPLDQTAEAFRIREAGHLLGKVILTISS